MNLFFLKIFHWKIKSVHRRKPFMREKMSPFCFIFPVTFIYFQIVL